MAYSKGIIAIPEVTGNIVITVTTESTQLINLFDSSTASYNYRIRNVGALGSDGTGNVVTAPIDITNLSALTIQGVTETPNGEGVYLRICLYSSSVGNDSDYVQWLAYSSATYSLDVAALKTQHPTATHIRLQIHLSSSSISTSDTANLAIYGT